MDDFHCERMPPPLLLSAKMNGRTLVSQRNLTMAKATGLIFASTCLLACCSTHRAFLVDLVVNYLFILVVS